MDVGPDQSGVVQGCPDGLERHLAPRHPWLPAELRQPRPHDRDRAQRGAHGPPPTVNVANRGTGRTATRLPSAPVSSSKSTQSRTASTRTPSASSTYPTANGTNPSAGGT